MLTSKPANHASRILLLAGDSKNTVLAELAGSIHRLAYSPYGQQSSPQEVMTHLGFNGELREAQTDWYFLGNGYRVYNPRLMRFHSPDKFSPFGKGWLNAYMYCGGEPVMRADPTGEAWGLGKVWNIVSDKFGDYVWPLFSQVGTGGANAGRVVAKVSKVEYVEAAIGTRTTFSSPPRAERLGRSRRPTTKLTWKTANSIPQATNNIPWVKQIPSVHVVAATPMISGAISRRTSTYSSASNSSSSSYYSASSSASTLSSVNISLPHFSSGGESGFSSMRSRSSHGSHFAHAYEVRRM